MVFDWLRLSFTVRLILVFPDTVDCRSDRLSTFHPMQVHSRWAWCGSVRPSTGETGPASPRGCLLNGSPRCSSSSWASSRSPSPAGSWWHRIGAGKLPSTPGGSPSPAVSRRDLRVEKEETGSFVFFFFRTPLMIRLMQNSELLVAIETERQRLSRQIDAH